MAMRAFSLILWTCLLGALATSARASDLDEFKVKRQEVFEFSEKPRATRSGDRIEIAFASKDYCDATVAIEDAQGKIVRHLVSGVLGPAAPEPFQKNSLKQTLVWDGKDDQGKYIDDKSSHTIRVSLGLQPRFERNLFWEPKRRLGSFGGGSILINTPTPLLQAAPEGVYVFEGLGVEQLQLYDHQGNYVRALYPFAADKLEKIQGLDWYTFPQDGRKFPLRTGFAQATFLTSGTSSVVQGGSHGGGPSTAASAATALVVQGNQIALVGQKRLNRVSTNGTTGGLPLEGPVVSFEQPEIINRSLPRIGPTSAAFSPDGKWLYLTGYTWGEAVDTLGAYNRHKYLQGVTKVPYAEPGEMQPFAGRLASEEYGAEPERFTDPLSVACDPEGRVYVADYMNDRIQVFSPEGRLLKSIPCTKPARVQIHPKTRALYVFSWMLPTENMKRANARQTVTVKATLTRLKSFEDPRPETVYALPFGAPGQPYGDRVGSYSFFGGLEYCVELDPWTDPPTLWMVNGLPKANTIEGVGIQMYAVKEKELVKLRDFSEEALRTLGKSRLPAFWRQRLYVNPKTGLLYLTEGHTGALGKMFKEIVEIDPVTGKTRLVQIPFDAEDMAFDADGLIYLRDYLALARYDPGDFGALPWREVPWDYGEERKEVSANANSDRRTASLLSTIVTYSGTSLHKGGLAISQNGNLVISCYVTKDNPAAISLRTDEKPASLDGNETRAADKKWAAGNLFPPRFYPGRMYWGEVYVFNKHGQFIYKDAVPGITELFGVYLDREDNVYLLSTLTRMLGEKPYYNGKSGTLMKFKPGVARVKVAGMNGLIPVKLSKSDEPKRPADLFGYNTKLWVEGAEWKYGGVGFCGKNAICSCWYCRFALDFFARSFVPEVDRCTVAVLDSNGNLILRVGRYGNVEDGRPLDLAGGPPDPRPLGGDEVGLFYAPYLATQTDRRLFIADPGNGRILSVRLQYHAEETIALRDVPDAAGK